MERISDYRITEMLDHLQKIDREECGIDREHMHTLRCLIGSYSDLWDHIKHTGGVEHG